MKISLFVSVILLMFALGCQNKPNNQKTIVVREKAVEKALREQPVYLDTLFLEKSVLLISHYLSIKDALVIGDNKKSAHMAKLILPVFVEDQNPVLKIIYSKLYAISQTEDLAEQRKHFYPLSEAVYAVMKTSKQWPSLLYKQYCPMAFDDTGAWWLSEEKEIMNPYFGDEMLHCGMVQEEF